MASGAPKILFGPDVLDALPSLIESEGIRRLMVVSGPNVWKGVNGDRLLRELANDIHIARFADYAVNPRIEDIETCVDITRDERADAILGIGGGTALDIAKATAILDSQNGSFSDHVEKKAPLNHPRKRKLILAPTTSGTGSEMTCFAVVYKDRRKFSLESPSMIADWAVVDTSVAVTAPRGLMSQAGIDAFCQAVESYWSNRATVDSCSLSRRAIDLIWNNLEAAVLQSSAEACMAMSEAAMLAGRAIEITRTTAPHALSYPLTIRHDVPHGQACALTLPSFLVFNNQVTDETVAHPEGAGIVSRRIGEIVATIGASCVHDAAARIESFMRSVGLATRLEQVVADPEMAREDIVAELNVDRLGNNPRIATLEDIRRILQLI